jgi:TetR/AcrR family transcriptional regulator, fatty acid metabolism regulator protein
MKPLTVRQNEILDAALGIIAEHGIQRMTIKNLARAIAVTEPALYRHFRSKFDILQTILVRYRNDMLDLIEQTWGAAGSPAGSIESLYRGMFGAFVKQPALSVVIFSEDLFRYDRRLSKEVASIIELTHDRIDRALRDGVRIDEIRSDVPAKQLAWMVMGTMRLLITKWRISGYKLDLVREGRQAVIFLRRVMAPSRKR